MSESKLWRDRAEEARARATEMMSKEAREQLIVIAEAYERLAHIAERRDKRAASDT